MSPKKTEPNKAGTSFSDIVSWFEYYNPFDDEGIYASNIESAFLVGSRARGDYREDSDYDIAVIFPASLRELLREEGEVSWQIDSLSLSERLHMGFGGEMPEGVDYQIFWSDDPELETYSKIPVR